MIKIDISHIKYEQVLQLCINGISKKSLNERLSKGLVEFLKISLEYESLACSGKLFKVLPCGDENDIVMADLTKKELVNLYEYYFRSSTKPAREIYDKIILIANEKCPFCGGIGRPKNLDHFMPKSFFPQFSVLPVNLVPACRDCNMDCKIEKYPSSENEQIIHPYLDQDKFFQEQWIAARVILDNPCYIEYYCSPPEHWNSIDRERVQKHFEIFDIAKRYSIQAAEELVIIIQQRNTFLKNSSPEEYSKILLSTVDSLYLKNHWKKVLYNCLSKDTSFCNNNFKK